MKYRNKISEKKAPLLSIHVSVFNLENYIEQCLDSILTQDFSDYELILIDNGSTDRSIGICERYAKNYLDKIIYKKLPLPTQVGRPYKHALHVIRGEYFISVDGDDYLAAGCLGRVAEIIKAKHPDIIMGTFLSAAEPGCPALRDAMFDPKKISGVDYSEALGYLAAVPNFHTVQWRFIVNSTIIKILLEQPDDFEIAYSRLVKESTFGDMINVLTILANANSMELMEEPFYVHRSRRSSLSAVSIENNRGVAYLAGLITMGAFFTEDNIGKIRNLVQSQLSKFCSLYSNVCTTLTEDGYVKLAELIDTYRGAFLNLRGFQISPLCNLCDFVVRYGTLQGLKKFSKLQKESLFIKLHPFFEKDIYVFPTGICGESTILLLKRWNAKIKGFLDNDPTKETFLFQGYPCMLPNHLRDLTDEQRKNTAVVIATSYQHLIPVLKEQLTSLGVPEHQIIVTN